MIRTRFLVVVAALVASISVMAQAPIPDGAVFRVFLKDGRALPSYGESAVTGDRVVFTLIIGSTKEQTSLQLVSLPVSSVDVARTSRYADALRVVHYTSTRGDIDYAAMTQEVQRAVTELGAVQDPKKRLELARAARERLLAWAKSTYGYRASEIRELTELLDEVIAELATAAGEKQVALELRAGVHDVREPLLPVPSASESIAMALAAAAATDHDDDRLAILRAAAPLAEKLPEDSAVRLALRRELDGETDATAAYATLASEIRAQAEAARKRADLAGLARVSDAMRARDQALGGRRPDVIASLVGELDESVARVKAHHDAVARYTRVRGTLLAYERTIRPVMSGFEGLRPVLMAIQDIRYTAYERLVRADERLKGFALDLALVDPPEDLADVHATLASALRMAGHACERRRLSSSIISRPIAEEASSAAAGALLLLDQMRTQLVARLYPPKIQ